jgi:hypothetical protein
LPFFGFFIVFIQFKIDRKTQIGFLNVGMLVVIKRSTYENIGIHLVLKIGIYVMVINDFLEQEFFCGGGLVGSQTHYHWVV